MKKRNPPEWSLSKLTGEFKREKTERRYFDGEIRNILPYLRLIFLLLGFLFLAFAIPDWFVLSSRRVFFYILVLRLIFFSLMLLTSVRVHTIQSVRSYWIGVTAVEILCVALFILSSILYDPADFMIQSFGLMVILSAFFLIPNRYVIRLIVNLLSIVWFLGVSWITFKGITRMDISVVGVYLLLIVGIGITASVQTSLYKRRQHVTNHELHSQAITDPLTRIFNRQKFNEELVREISRSIRNRTALSLVLMDLDDFKSINDRYGHHHGDSVLIELTEQLQKIIRITDVFARWGGEEFILLLPSTNMKQAVELTERIRSIINNISIQVEVLANEEDIPDKVSVDGFKDDEPVNITVSCSFGVTVMQTGDTPAALIRRADEMLYRAKANGKNQVVSDK